MHAYAGMCTVRGMRTYPYRTYAFGGPMDDNHQRSSLRTGARYVRTTNDERRAKNLRTPGYVAISQILLHELPRALVFRLLRINK